jgi:hypothetical protein
LAALVGSALAFGKFLQDQLRDHSRLLSDNARQLFAEQKYTTGGAIALTLGWHVGSIEGTQCLYKEGGGGGFHCMMRLYRAAGVGTVIMTNATGLDVTKLLDSVDSLALRILQRTRSKQR